MKPGDFWRIFTLPLALALATAIGLLAALLADGLWDGVSWLGLGAPLAVAAYFIFAARTEP